uniref:Uncharacterized protein n=1 Tax=Oryctolagus cuniculus TaxID=9986 RepID=A0A5F9DKJ3_RABIT
VVKGLLLEVERIQSRRHLEEAALRHADRAGPHAPGALVDAQLADVVGPGQGVSRGQHHSVAAGGRRHQRGVCQGGLRRRRQGLQHGGIHPPQVLKEALHHVVPTAVVVLQGHFGDLQHRGEPVSGTGKHPGLSAQRSGSRMPYPTAHRDSQPITPRTSEGGKGQERTGRMWVQVAHELATEPEPSPLVSAFLLTLPALFTFSRKSKHFPGTSRGDHSI